MIQLTTMLANIKSTMKWMREWVHMYVVEERMEVGTPSGRAFKVTLAGSPLTQLITTLTQISKTSLSEK